MPVRMVREEAANGEWMLDHGLMMSSYGRLLLSGPELMLSSLDLINVRQTGEAIKEVSGAESGGFGSDGLLLLAPLGPSVLEPDLNIDQKGIVPLVHTCDR